MSFGARSLVLDSVVMVTRGVDKELGYLGWDLARKKFLIWPEVMSHEQERAEHFDYPLMAQGPVDLSTYRAKEQMLIIGPHGMSFLSPLKLEHPQDVSTYKQKERLLGVVGRL